MAFVVALLGIALVFRGEIPLEGAGAVGDWMSLAAGMAWSVGSALVFNRARAATLHLTTWALGAAAAVSLACVMLLGEGVADVGTQVDFDIWKLSGVVFAFGGLYVVPVMLITLWGTTQFSAVTMGFLLTGEIVSGVATSAFLLGEPFGLLEVVGTILIIVGASTEIFAPHNVTNVSAHVDTVSSD